MSQNLEILEVQSLKSRQVTEEDILEEYLNTYYSEENFKDNLKEYQDLQNYCDKRRKFGSASRRRHKKEKNRRRKERYSRRKRNCKNKVSDL